MKPTLKNSLLALRGLILVAFIIVAAVLIALYPGTVTFFWFGHRIEMITGIFVPLVLLLMLLFTTIHSLWKTIWRLPLLWAERQQRRSERKSLSATLEGWTAFFSGEYAEARRFAKRAEVSMGNTSPIPPAIEPMMSLLGAHTALINGKITDAKERFTLMTKVSSISFFGYHGLSLVAAQEQNWPLMRSALESALAIRPSSPWVMTQLMLLDLRVNLYDKASAMVEKMLLRQVIDKAESRRRQAIIHWMQAEKAQSQNKEEIFLQKATHAHQEAPQIISITLELARYYAQQDKTAKAIKLLFQSYMAAPHASLAVCLMELRHQNQPLEVYKEVESLVSCAPHHPESLYALAQSALRAKLWGQARAHAEALQQILYTQRVATLFARIAEGEQAYDPSIAHQCWEKVVDAPIDPTWICQNCQSHQNKWTALCPACGQFDRIQWGIAQNSLQNKAISFYPLSSYPLHSELESEGGVDVRPSSTVMPSMYF